MFPGELRLEVHRDGKNQHVVPLVLVLHVAVPGRDLTFRCVFRPHYHVQNAVVQNFR